MTRSANVSGGYLVIGDISGYTRFVTTTELEHAQSIVRKLTELMIGALEPPLRFGLAARMKVRLMARMIRRILAKGSTRLAELLVQDGQVAYE
jgi:hypothetical protein